MSWLTPLGLGALVLTWLFPAAVGAIVSASGPDDICPPTEDPCLIDEPVSVTNDVFDFGSRAVHITGAGRLEGGVVSIRCGDFIVDVGSSTMAIASTFSDGGGGCVEIVADSINFDGKIKAKGLDGGEVEMTAIGDIFVDGSIDVSATNGGDREGGFIVIGSTQAGVVVHADLLAKAGPGAYYGEGGVGGGVSIDAETDVDIAGKIDVSGGGYGGYLYVGSDNSSITISDDVNCNSGQFGYAGGGNIDLYAYQGDITIAPPASGKTRLSSNGGGKFYAYYGSWYSGYGGVTRFVSGGDIVLLDKTVVESKGGPVVGEGGRVYFRAQGLVDVGGEIICDGQGKPQGGDAGFMRFDSYDQGVTVRDTAFLSAKANDSAGSILIETEGPVALDGTLTVRSIGAQPYYSHYGGSVYVYGPADVTVDGTIKTGGVTGYGGKTEFDVCRVTLQDGARLENQSNGNDITVGESFVANSGSVILADGAGGENVIRAQNAGKPPVLMGDIVPPPLLLVSGEGTLECAVCGNLEIDGGESCDDGNMVSGDGCRDDCQDETCIVQTPGFPTTDLCDDGDACTIDTCIPGGAGCDHLASCEEGVACTVDVCNVDVCEHTPDDLLCDDGNDCTDDICNSATGCVYANLTGNGCEDGDFCTVTGICASGSCAATDVSLAGRGKILVKFKPLVDDDKASMKGELPLAEFTTSPTATGMEVLLFDENDQQVFGAQIPAGFFEDTKGDGSKFRYRVSDASPPSALGVKSVSISLRPTKGIAKAKVKLKDTELPGALDQTSMSLSLLFGADPAIDECVSIRSLPCTSSSKRTRCKE